MLKDPYVEGKLRGREGYGMEDGPMGMAMGFAGHLCNEQQKKGTVPEGKQAQYEWIRDASAEAGQITLKWFLKSESGGDGELRELMDRC